MSFATPSADRVCQSRRQIPVIASVDVVVVGGTSAGVAAAIAASRGGAKVYLAAPRPYLGEDLCAKLRLEVEPGQPLETELAKTLFGSGEKATPGHVKACLNRALLDQCVAFMLASYVTDVLRDRSGQLCGVVLANRSGRQAIVAKVVIDATDYAWVCRRADCACATWTGGLVRFERNVLLEKKARWPFVWSKKPSVGRTNFETGIVEQELPMRDLSFVSLASAEHLLRDKTPSKKLLRGAESLFCVPPNPVVCVKTEQAFSEPPGLELNHFRPRGQDRLYVLSGCADIPRAKAAELLRPLALAEIGGEVGCAAAALAQALPNPEGVQVSVSPQPGREQGDVKELLCASGHADLKLEAVSCPKSSLPVLASVDVVVVGGGTAGAAAGIAAARKNVNTLVLDYQEGLGGMGTVGMIGKPYHGRNTGFAKEVPWPDTIEGKMEWYRKELRKAGGEVWFGVLGCGAVVDGNTVKGAVICTPEGRGVVLAKVVIDGTGNADVAIAAGADFMFGMIEEGDIALQGTGLPPRPAVGANANSDYLLVDESDFVDVWRAFVSVQLGHGKEFDSGTLIQTRERRRVVGDHVLQYVDQLAGRTYPDSVVFSDSNYDSHGYPSSPFFGLLPHDETSRKANHPAPGGACFTPYRCLLPRKLEGMLVIGLGISMDRDASAMVRMQLDMANQGYAAGVAAAMAVQDGLSPRRIDLRTLQRHLVETGCLPNDVLVQQDSFPLPVQTVERAVDEFGKATNPGSAGQALAVLLTHREAALPFLRQSFDGSEGPAKLLYAQVLGVFGDKRVVPLLTAALDNVDHWDEKIKQGHMADHAYLPTPIDSLIMSLGYAGDTSAVPAILRVVERLSAEETLSHHRAVALALERLADSSAAGPLAALLRKPGMQGYALTALPPAGPSENRAESIREISLARALYRCGDDHDLGLTILKQYSKDLRGLFARHAQAVLSKEK